jgi:tetratricopeptide (TPR) repeat protein
MLLFLLFLFNKKAISQTPDPVQKHMADSLLFLLNTAPPDTNRVNILNNLTTYLARIRQYDEVLKYASESRDLSKKLNFQKGLKGAYQKLAMAHGVKNNYDEALRYNFLVLKISEEEGNKWVSGTYNEIASIYYNQGKYKESLEYLLKGKANLEEYTKATGVSKKDGQAFLSKNIGLIYEKFGEPEKALEQYHSGLKHWLNGKEVFDSIYICDSYGLIGNVLKNQGKYNEAVKYFTDALIIAEKINKTVSLMTSNRNLGLLNATQGNYPEAMNYFMKALKVAETRNFPDWMAELNNDIGSLYRSQKNYPEALDYFTVAKDFSQKISSKKMLSTVYTSIGVLYGDQNLLEESIEYNIKAMKISEEFNNKDGLYTANHNIGLLYYKQAEILESAGKMDLMTEKLATALQYQKAALEITRITNIRLQQAHTQIAIGSILCKQATIEKSSGAKEKYATGIKSLNNGFGTAIEFNDKELIKDAYSALSKAYHDGKDFKNALYYSNLYIQANDSLINDQTSRKIEQIRIQYATEKAVNEEKLRQESDKAQMQWVFSRKEDSIRFQQKLMSMQMMQQASLSRQQEQELQLKQASLDLANKENEYNRLSFLKSQAELEAEQSKRKDKEQQLTISEQEKVLQNNQLTLQQTQLNLKESQIQAQKKQLLFYLSGIILSIFLFVFIYRNIKNRQRADRQISAERLKSEKASAAHKMAELELQSLRAQLNPHFMFNSLNAIQELILKEDNDNSHLYLSRFSELLRMLLDNANQPFVPLRKEINLLELYLSLENLRIPDLKYSIEIDPLIDSNKITIPNMMLQPYIENAIWHGLSHKKGERNLKVRITRNQDNIVCEVEDNGVGRKLSAELKSLYRKEHRSRGMELLSKRFSLLSKEYGSDIHTGIEDLHDNGTATGTRVTITVPSSLTEQFKPVYS